jgi:putative transposase
MRRPRIIEPGRPHHVTLRGDDDRALFASPRDHRRFLGHLDGATTQHAIELHHLCLMPDEVHLVATPHERDALARWVRDFAQPYAHHRNRTTARRGRLFAQRFGSEVLADDGALSARTAAVELRPVRAGLVRRAVDYPWSSAHIWVGDRARSCIARSLTPSGFVLALGDSPEGRAAGFAAWLDGVPQSPQAMTASQLAASRTHATCRATRSLPSGSRSSALHAAAHSPESSLGAGASALRPR